MKFLAIALLAVIAFSATDARKCWPVTDAPAPTDAPTDAPTNAPTDAPTDAPTNAPTNPPSTCNRAEIKRIIINAIINGANPGDGARLAALVVECLRSIGLIFDDAPVIAKITSLFDSLNSVLNSIRTGQFEAYALTHAAIDFASAADAIDLVTGGNSEAFMQFSSEFEPLFNSIVRSIQLYATIPTEAYTFITASTDDYENLVDYFFDDLQAFKNAVQAGDITLP